MADFEEIRCIKYKAEQLYSKNIESIFHGKQ